MMNDFTYWLAQNGLSEAFTTMAGDTFYVNREKGFGVLRKYGEYSVHSFCLNDIIEFKTYDDENLVVEWSCITPWRVMPRSTRFSTNEVYMKIRFRNQLVVRLQIFRGVNGNISRSSYEHMNLLNYACQISEYIYNCAIGR